MDLSIALKIANFLLSIASIPIFFTRVLLVFCSRNEVLDETKKHNLVFQVHAQ
jgi:hypothetical protein